MTSFGGGGNLPLPRIAPGTACWIVDPHPSRTIVVGDVDKIGECTVLEFVPVGAPMTFLPLGVRTVTVHPGYLCELPGSEHERPAYIQENYLIPKSDPDADQETPEELALEA